MKKYLKNLKNSWKKKREKEKVSNLNKTKITTHIPGTTKKVVADEGVDAAKAKFYANFNRFPEVHISSIIPTVIISDELQAQITYLHNKFGNIEWSGFLLYEVVSGSLASENNDLVIKAVGVFPCDVGSAAYTEYDPGDFILDMDTTYDFLEKGYKLGHIHTHHSMSCFFSGTDMAELHNNAPKYSDSYYLSLIVNKSNSYCAKIAKMVTVEEVQKMAHIDCEIEYAIKKGVLDQITKIQPKSVFSYGSSYTPFSYSSKTNTSKVNTNRAWEGWDDEDYLYGDSRVNKHTTQSVVKPATQEELDKEFDEWYKEQALENEAALEDLDKFLSSNKLQLEEEAYNGYDENSVEDRIINFSIGKVLGITPQKKWYLWTLRELITYVTNYMYASEFVEVADKWEEVFLAVDETKLKHGVNKLQILFVLEDNLAHLKRTIYTTNKDFGICINAFLKKVEELKDKLLTQKEEERWQNQAD